MKNNKTVNQAINKRMSVSNQNYEKLLTNFEKNLVNSYTEALRSINLQLKDIYAKVGNDLSNLPAENLKYLSKYKRLDTLKIQIYDSIKDSIKALQPQLNKEVLNSIKTSIKQGYYSSQWAIETGSGIDFSLPILNNKVIEASILNPVDAIKWNDRLKRNLEETITRTQNAITNGLIQGKGYRETARDLRKQLDISVNKSNRIIRTESHRAQIEGRNQTIEQVMPKAERLGLKPVKILRAVKDNRTRPQSASMDGQEANADGLFTYPNGVKGLPSQTGIAEYDINDRETIVIQYKGWSEETLKSRKAKFMNENLTFKQWAEAKGITKSKYGEKY